MPKFHQPQIAYSSHYKLNVQLGTELDNNHTGKHAEITLFTWLHWSVNDIVKIINHAILLFHGTLFILVFAKRIYLFNKTIQNNARYYIW